MDIFLTLYVQRVKFDTRAKKKSKEIIAQTRKK